MSLRRAERVMQVIYGAKGLRFWASNTCGSFLGSSVWASIACMDCSRKTPVLGISMIGIYHLELCNSRARLG